MARVFSAYKVEERSSSGEEHIAAFQVTEDEARWLLSRLQRDGKLHSNEQALLLFLRENASHIHPVLKPALDQVQPAG